MLYGDNTRLANPFGSNSGLADALHDETVYWQMHYGGTLGWQMLVMVCYRLANTLLRKHLAGKRQF